MILEAQNWHMKMNVGQTFSSFLEFQNELTKTKAEGNQPLQVFNSKTAKDYNCKRNPSHLVAC